MRLLIAAAALSAGVSLAAPAPQARPVPAAAGQGQAYRAAVSAAGYVYVSTIRPRDVGEASTIASQTADVFAQLKQVLEAAGSSIGQLCAVTVSLKSASDFDAMNAAYAAILPESPPARTTIVAWLRGNTKIEIAAVAVPAGARRETLRPARWAKNPRPYSYVVRTDDLVFFSGLISRRGLDDAPVTGTVKTQMNTILDNAGTLLETAGLGFDDVVAARVYLRSPYDFEDMNEVYGETFDADAPARATAVVDLTSTDADVEVTFIASQQPKTIIGGRAAGVPVSAAVQAGPRVWLSGVIGDTDRHPRDAAAQARDIFDRMRKTMGLAGLSYADVVDATVYLRDNSAWPAIDAIFGDVFPADPPARTAIPARLVVEPGLVEMLVTAIRK